MIIMGAMNVYCLSSLRSMAMAMPSAMMAAVALDHGIFNLGR